MQQVWTDAISHRKGQFGYGNQANGYALGPLQASALGSKTPYPLAKGKVYK